MGSPIPGPLVAHFAVVFTAVVLLTGVLAIIGSTPTSEVREHALSPSNVTAKPAPEGGLSATATSAPVLLDSYAATVTPVPGRNSMLSQPDMKILTLPVNLTGKGSGSTQSFRLEPGPVAFDLRQDAPGDFEVWLMCGNDQIDRLLENGVIAEGPLTEQIINDGTYFLNVISDVGWHIDVSQVEPE